MRVSLKISIAALAVVACLAMVPAASATTIDLFVGSTEVATMTLTSGGSCASGDVCVTVTGVNGNQIRTGGVFVGFTGSGVSSSTEIIDYSGTGTIGQKSGTCGGIGSTTACFQITKGASGSFNSVTFVLTNAQLSGITGAGIHIIGPACGTQGDGFKTCFTTSSTVSTVPEPGTLGLLGTGLVGLAGLARRRFLS